MKKKRKSPVSIRDGGNNAVSYTHLTSVGAFAAPGYTTPASAFTAANSEILQSKYYMLGISGATNVVTVNQQADGTFALESITATAISTLAEADSALWTVKMCIRDRAKAGSIFSLSSVMGTNVPKILANITTANRLKETEAVMPLSPNIKKL